MKRETSVCGKFLEAVPSSRKLVAFMGVSVLFLSASVTAQSNGLKFSGSVVNAGCNVSQTSTGATDDVRALQVSGITVQISTARDVCAEKAIPFTLKYEVVPVSSSQAGMQNIEGNQTGLMIITYQ